MAAPHFELDVRTDAAGGVVRFRLRGGDGQHLAAHQVRIGESDPWSWQGLFDTRRHVERYAGGTRYTDHPATAEELLDLLGAFLGEKVLGEEITSRLAAGVQNRTLLVRLPAVTGDDEAENRLAAAFARVPWEIARPSAGEEPLMARNVVVRAVTPDLEEDGHTVEPPDPGEPVRVLMVYAEAPGSRPLAMRRERETLLDLFHDEILPERQVQVDVLCHGVTRDLLRDQVEEVGGYHVVHWSGHGHHDLLELYGEGGEPDLLSGEELLGLFAEAGGFLPNVVFLSSCLSGTFVEVRDWESMRRALVTTEAGQRAAGSGAGAGDGGGAVRAAGSAPAANREGSGGPAATGAAPGTATVGADTVEADTVEAHGDGPDEGQRLEGRDREDRTAGDEPPGGRSPGERPAGPAGGAGGDDEPPEPGQPAAAGAAQVATENPGYAGTALALLRAGVPLAVAMRYEVGDAYARDLARGFYQRLLGHRAPKPPAQALALARGELLRKASVDHHAVDHATPLLFGRDLSALAPPAGRSEQLGRRRPQPQPLLSGSTELDRPEFFVGRSRPLTDLRLRWLEGDGPGVAVIQGLAGLGKTALAAEAIHLWHRSFRWVFAFQSKPDPLRVDDFLRTLDIWLAQHSRVYEEACKRDPARAVWLAPDDRLRGEARHRELRGNLLEALRDERILLVLDNFETHLETVAGDDGYACADPEWDRLLEHLAEKLPGTGSRLLITTRHRPACLAAPGRALHVPLGPLPMEEAMLFLQETPALRELVFGDGEAWELARRLLSVSRGHPLILSRLGALAEDRAALDAALTELETRGYERLPDLFTRHLSDGEREEERQYLEDVAMRSVDLLLERVSPEARSLLWVATRASEPVPEGLLREVWIGRSPDEAAAHELRALLERADELPEELRAQLDEPPPEVREALAALPPAAEPPPFEPPLAELLDADLLTREKGALAFHELVKERATHWAEEHPEVRGERTEEEVWRIYGVGYGRAFQARTASGEEGAREQAAEAGRRGLSYLVRARAFGELGAFAGRLVTGTGDPRLLRAVIADLESVAEQVPEGKPRWSVRTYLADAVRRAGRPDEALPLYEQAVAEAEVAEHWGDVAWICQNQGGALLIAGHLDAARRAYRRSVEARVQAGSPRVHVIGSELEALRIDVVQGRAGEALPEIEERLDEVRGWWRRHREGEAVPEAPDADFLGRVLIGALDIARQAHLTLEHWQACLDLLEEIEATKRARGEGEHGLARARFNRYGPLLRLGRLDQARDLLEDCLRVFRNTGDAPAESTVLSALADLWDKRGDHNQAAALERQALAICNRYPDLADRAMSHGNLSNYLDRQGETGEAAQHLLAALAYDLVIGYQQDLAIRVRNLALRIRRAAAAGDTYTLPPLPALLQQPAFAPLQHTLAQRGVDLADLQAAIDRLVDQARQAATSND